MSTTVRERSDDWAEMSPRDALEALYALKAQLAKLKSS